MDEKEKINLKEDKEYQYNFKDKVDSIFSTGKGINEEVVKEISRAKNEPEWMLNFRLDAYRKFVKMPFPNFGPDVTNLDFDSFTYFTRYAKGDKTNWEEVPETIKRRENTVLAILLNGDLNIFQIIKQNIKLEDFKDETNKEIVKKLYEEFEKGNSNINGIIDTLEEEEQNHITEILADDYEINDVEKAIDDVIRAYDKDRLNERKFKILELLESSEIPQEEKGKLGKELSDIIVRLAKMK